MDLVIPDFSPLVPQETILISRQEKAGGGGTGMSSSTLVMVECASDITNVMLW